jgi:stage V sporulation protein R
MTSFRDSSNGFPVHSLTPDLHRRAQEIFEMAQDYGLTFFPIMFRLVSPKDLNAIAAYTGFPNRIPHWTYGMEFESIHKRYKYGQSKIYELVINTNPVIAYLLNTNTLMDQKLVMIHVCGHADFFFNNCWFEHTNRAMLDQMANNASRVRRYIDRVGDQRVEDFLDICFSLDNLVDPYLDHIKRKRIAIEEEDFEQAVPIPKLKSNDYMDKYINTEEFIEMQKKRLQEEREKRKKFPEDSARDILGFLVEHAPLQRWQRNLLAMVREESYYFAPQMMTKIMNEGWATYIHSKFMTTKLCDHSEIIDYCDSQSRAIAQGRGINPYRLGLQLFRSIEDRWNKGQFGLEWERCNDLEKKANWDRQLGLGKEKIFQVRRTHNDLTFIDDFLTPEFCKENKLFSWKPGEYSDHIEVSREFATIKDKLLRNLANAGQPVIQLDPDGANWDNKGELKLTHIYDGQELDPKKAKHTLLNLYKLWSRPVHIETIEVDEDSGNEIKILLSYNGEGHSKSLL